jgi:pSer/pThr/pTyr-binding forkhead associated (FHA) protein
VPNAHASLARLAESEQAAIPVPIPITDDEVTFGKDPEKATLVFDDPSVEPVHARLRLVNGNYRISDEGTTAGTWVNYTPVSKEGATLQHGDLIHIGRVGFRFLIREPARVRKPVVTREDRLT